MVDSIVEVMYYMSVGIGSLIFISGLVFLVDRLKKEDND